MHWIMVQSPQITLISSTQVYIRGSGKKLKSKLTPAVIMIITGHQQQHDHKKNQKNKSCKNVVTRIWLTHTTQHSTFSHLHTVPVSIMRQASQLKSPSPSSSYSSLVFATKSRILFTYHHHYFHHQTYQ